MNPRKFYAQNSRDALRKVRETLGPNAVVLSNRPVSNGVEIIAVPETELAGMTDDDSGVLRSSPDYETSPVTTAWPENTEQTDLSDKSDKKEPEILSSSTRSSTEQVLHEISDMKHLLEAQLSMIAWGDLQRRDPARVKLSKHLLNCGFSPSLTRALIEAMPPESTFDSGLQWVRYALDKNLNATENGTEFIDRGGVYAVVGPTGVGKTATAAKLAARYVLRYGVSKLALLTMDTYRIGAHEQLRVYGQILGVPVYPVRDAADLEIKLNDLSDKHMILIDTVGMSQKDQYIAEHLKILSQSRIPIRPLLLLSATSSAEVLEDVVSTYQNSLKLHGCILTKTDEAVSLGSTMDILIRKQLQLLFLTNGQRVPEDLCQPNRQYLLHKSLKHDIETSPHSFDDEDISLIMTDSGLMFEKPIALLT